MKLKLRARVVEKRQEALESINLMMDSYRKRLRSEQQSDGLIVVKAVYGNITPDILAIFRSLQLTGPDQQIDAAVERELGLIEELGDVTVPLQLAVQNSRLTLAEDLDKTDILGFFDPCPWLRPAKKQLLVLYRYRGQLHQVLVSAKQTLIAPLRSKCVILF